MSSSNKTELFSLTTGSVAQEIISKDQDGIVHGITSRGLFIKMDSHHILYLTSDPFKGPLTINLDTNLPFPQKISPGTLVYLKPGNILIPDAGLVISFRDSTVWEAALPTEQMLPVREQERRLKSLGEQIMGVDKKTGLSWMLPYLFDLPGISPPEDASKQRQLESALNLRRSYRAGDAAAMSSRLSDFLGRGPGLTPSGDDFVLGVMLFLNRWKDAPVKGADLKILNHGIIKSAYKTTTNLSANLIECAALGLADERLLNALDWIKSDIQDGGHLVDRLLEWGHSSGMDVFAGYTALFSTSINQ